MPQRRLEAKLVLGVCDVDQSFRPHLVRAQQAPFPIPSPKFAFDSEGGRVHELHTPQWLRLEAERDGNCIVLAIGIWEATRHNAWHGQHPVRDPWPSNLLRVKVDVRLRWHDTEAGSVFNVGLGVDDLSKKLGSERSCNGIYQRTIHIRISAYILASQATFVNSLCAENI